ncbi:MAG: 6-phosphogluconolactonase [Anaerolineaceae bacterium]|nr:6-phosphogluconolactonase [Anaerolineaceae bacterium]
MSQIRILPDKTELMQAAAQLVVQTAEEAIAKRGRFSMALSGGSTPRGLYTLLTAAPYREQIKWANVHLFWGDERCVPPDDADSNYRMTRESLLDHVPLPPENIHRMQGELPPEEAAAAYEHELTGFFGQSTPHFDLILLGMGDDGHTASLFPHTAALDEHQKWVTANHVPQKGVWRLTLTRPVINAARQVTFLISGAEKAARLREVLYGVHQPHHLPSQFIHPVDGDLIWLLDRATASQLPEH